MQVSSWFSHTRLWGTLALLLATNLAAEIDGFELIDAAECICEESQQSAGLVFFLNGERVGRVDITEFETINIDVNQNRLNTPVGKWSATDTSSSVDLEVLPEQGDSTTLQLDADSFFRSAVDDQEFVTQVRYENVVDPEDTEERLLAVRPLRPFASVRRSPAMLSPETNLLVLSALEEGPLQTGEFWVRIENNTERLFAAIQTRQDARGLRFSAAEAFEQNLFRFEYEFDPSEYLGTDSILGAVTILKACGFLGISFQDQRSAINDVRIAAVLQVAIATRRLNRCPRNDNVFRDPP